MILTALILFGVAAVGGLVLATLHIRRNAAPVPLALLHGLLAATALALVVIAVIGMKPVGWIVYAIPIFVAAAFVGLVMFTRHVTKQSIGRGALALHIILAVAGVVMTLIWVIANNA